MSNYNKDIGKLFEELDFLKASIDVLKRKNNIKSALDTPNPHEEAKQGDVLPLSRAGTKKLELSEYESVRSPKEGILNMNGMAAVTPTTRLMMPMPVNNGYGMQVEA